jgi:hypothetical protein
MARLWRLVLVTAIMMTNLAASGNADEKSATIRLEVIAGSWTGARLQGLPAGGSLRLNVTTSGPITILLLGEEDYRAFPGRERPLFKGSADNRIGFEAALPESGDYYVIADNRQGAEPREVTVAMVARSPQTSGGLELGEQLQVLSRRIAQVFDLGGLEMRVEHCDRPDVVSDHGRVTVCLEYIELLVRETGDRQVARDGLLFTLLHEVARQLFRQQGQDSAGDQDLGGLAGALMVIFNQEDAARNQAGHFAAAQTDGALGRVTASPGHPLNPATARDLLNRLDDPTALVRGFQETFLPRMRTAVLEQLRAHAPGWVEPDRVADELARRGSG